MIKVVNIENEVGLIKFQTEDALFIRENFPGYFRDNSIENIERIIESWKETLSFCITFNGEKAGIISLGEKQDKKLSFGIMIKEEFRRRGIAKVAFQLIKTKAKEKGYSIIISSSSANNFASKSLHEKCGFNLIKTEINQAGNEMCRWEMNI